VDPATFRSRLRDKKLLAVYLFSGDQDLLKAEALEELRRAVGVERGSVRKFFGGSVEAGEILEARQNLSLLDPVAVIVVRQAARLRKTDADTLATNLPTLPPGPPIVLWDEAFDKRGKLFSEVARAGGEIEFAAPKRDAVARWLHGEARRLNHEITPAAAEQLVELVGVDLLRLRSTLERLSLALGSGARIDDECVAEQVASSRLHAIYELQGAVDEKQTLRAVGLLRRLIDEGEEIPALVGALFAEIRRLLIAREASPRSDLARLLEIHPFRAKKIAEAANRFSRLRLRRAVNGLAEVDLASKTGRGDAQAALEHWLIAVCESERKPGLLHVGRG
jgi:DNA polymerase III subunit delta